MSSANVECIIVQVMDSEQSSRSNFSKDNRIKCNEDVRISFNTTRAPFKSKKHDIGGREETDRKAFTKTEPAKNSTPSFFANQGSMDVNKLISYNAHNYYLSKHQSMARLNALDTMYDMDQSLDRPRESKIQVFKLYIRTVCKEQQAKVQALSNSLYKDKPKFSLDANIAFTNRLLRMKEVFNLRPNTILSTKYLVLITESIKVEEIDACLWIVCKDEEIYPPKIEELFSRYRQGADPSKIEQAERIIDARKCRFPWKKPPCGECLDDLLGLVKAEKKVREISWASLLLLTVLDDSIFLKNGLTVAVGVFKHVCSALKLPNLYVRAVSYIERELDADGVASVNILVKKMINKLRYSRLSPEAHSSILELIKLAFQSKNQKK